MSVVSDAATSQAGAIPALYPGGLEAAGRVLAAVQWPLRLVRAYPGPDSNAVLVIYEPEESAPRRPAHDDSHPDSAPGGGGQGGTAGRCPYHPPSGPTA